MMKLLFYCILIPKNTRNSIVFSSIGGIQNAGSIQPAFLFLWFYHRIVNFIIFKKVKNKN